MADIRAFFGGVPKKKPDTTSTTTSTPAAAASTSAAASASSTSASAKKSPSKKKTAVDASTSAASTLVMEKPTPKAKKSKAKKTADSDDAPTAGAPDEDADMEVVEEQKAPSKKKAMKDKTNVATGEKKTSTKKEKTAASSKAAASAVDVKSPAKPSAAASSSIASLTDSKSKDAAPSKQKKRIREEADEDESDVTIVEKPTQPEEALPEKIVVHRREASPKRAVVPMSASAFFANAPKPAIKPTDKLKAHVASIQHEQAKQKILDEEAALQREIDELQANELREAQEREEKEQAEAIAAVAKAEREEAERQRKLNPSHAAAAATSVDAMEDIAAPADVPLDVTDDIEEITKPLPKSPAKSPVKSPAKSSAKSVTTPVKSPPPSSKKAKLEPPIPASPNRTPSPAAASSSLLKSPNKFSTFTPDPSKAASLSAHPLMQSPLKPKPSSSPSSKRTTPTPSPPTPSSAPHHKPTAAKRAHATMENAGAPVTPKKVAAPTAVSASKASAMDVDGFDVDDFGGQSLQTHYDSYDIPEEDENEEVVQITDESPAKKLKTNAGTSVPAATGEKKKFNPYQKPAAPVALGTKEIPIAKPNCLTGLTFVLTGTGESITREDLSDLVKKYGGKVTTSLSKKTNFLVAGVEAGESKMAKARELKTKVINEDGFLQMLRDKSKGWTAPTSAASASSSSYTAASSSSTPSRPSVQIAPAGVPLPKPKAAVALAPKHSAAEDAILRSGIQKASDISDMLWVDAHRPLTTDAIIGNPGLVTKIRDWLTSWTAKRLDRESNMDEKKQIKEIKALLITGPPGIGKSTAATVIARSLGYEVIEFNASDVRNKKALDQVVGDITGNRGLTEFFTSKNAPSTPANAKAKPNVIIMDEVDGMGGNEDRGGMQELVSLIKKTRTPIICIGNDASSPKMKTLKNYVEHITWRRVPAAQIAPRIMEICRKEGLQVDRQSVEKLAESTGGDIRQILNFLQMYRLNGKAASFDDIKARMENSGKDFDLGPFDLVPKFFQSVMAQPGKPNDWIGDRQNLYFMDSDIIPLFIQENYLHMRPFLGGLEQQPKNAALRQRLMNAPNRQQLINDVLTIEQVSEAADAMSVGDLLSDSMFTEQDYTLMPSHAVLSTIYPAYLFRGGSHERLVFPGYLGKQSSRNKWLRIIRELKIALSTDIHVDNRDVGMYVLPQLRSEWLRLLQEEKVDAVIEALDHFGLDKEEFDQVMEFQEKLLPEEKRFGSLISSAIKSSFTRTWKKGTHLRKVSHSGKGDAGDVQRVRGAAFKETTDDGDDDIEEGEEENEDEDGEDGGDGSKPKPASPTKSKATKGTTKKAAASLAAGTTKEKKPRKPRAPKAPGAAGAKKAASKKKTKNDDDEDDDMDDDDF